MCLFLHSKRYKYIGFCVEENLLAAIMPLAVNDCLVWSVGPSEGFLALLDTPDEGLACRLGWLLTLFLGFCFFLRVCFNLPPFYWLRALGICKRVFVSSLDQLGFVHAIDLRASRREGHLIRRLIFWECVDRVAKEKIFFWLLVGPFRWLGTHSNN